VKVCFWSMNKSSSTIKATRPVDDYCELKQSVCGTAKQLGRMYPTTVLCVF